MDDLMYKHFKLPTEQATKNKHPTVTHNHFSHSSHSFHLFMFLFSNLQFIKVFGSVVGFMVENEFVFLCLVKERNK